MSIVNFPYNVSRRVHSRKPRRSKNDAPDERETSAAASAGAIVSAAMLRRERKRRRVRPITGENWEEMVRVLGPELTPDLMVDAWKLLNRYFRKL